MNLTHLKYALEVERTGSITKAAENLAMGQPNLSRVIKELEDTTGIRIFSRTSKGIVPTENGRIFLERAAEIVRQTQELENLFRDGSGRRQTFRVAGQSSNTLLHAFTRTARLLSDTGNYDCYLEECRPNEVLERVQHDDCHIGVMRAGSADIDALQRALWEKNIRCQVIGTFRYALVMPADHPLAGMPKVTADMLEPYTLVTSGGRQIEGTVARIVCFRSVSACLSSLGSLQGGYMITRPIPREVMDRYGLVTKPYDDGRGDISDLLIYRAEHKLYDAESIFIEEFKRAYWDLHGKAIR